MMLTKQGLLAALSALTEKPIMCGLYTNELDGDDVAMTDIVKAKCPPARVPDWKTDVEALHATGKKTTFKGKCGMVVGSYLFVGDAVISYSQLMDPVPMRSDEDIIHIIPRLKVKRSKE